LVAASTVIGRDRIQIRVEDEVLPATVRAVDYQSGLALLHTNHRIGTPITLGTYRSCAGQMVLAIGNAYGVQASPSLGFCAGSRQDGLMQFTAPITAGTVGGGLFDLSGNLIGVVIGGVGETERPDVGIAIPAHRISEIVRYLLMKGDRPVGYIGVTTTDIEITPPLEIAGLGQLASASASPIESISRGILVSNVVTGSPAATAGLRQGDILISMDGIQLRSASDLRIRVRQTRPGDVAEFQFIRQNRLLNTFARISRVPTEEMTVHYFSAVPGVSSTSDLPPDSIRAEIQLLKSRLLRLERVLENADR
jgi:S1-C subfamily serine protease